MDKKYFLICFMVLICTVGFVSASDDLNESSKITPEISVNASDIYTGDAIDIIFTDENKTPVSNINFTANVNKKDYLLSTDSEGKSSLKLGLASNKYVLSVNFTGDDKYSSVNSSFNITILKLDSNINPLTTTVIKGNYFYIYLKNQRYGAITGSTVLFNVDGKTYKSTTGNDGKAGFKISLNPYYHSLKISFAGNGYYNSVSKTVNLLVPATTSLVIGNTRLLTNGYLRIYLKSDTLPVISKKKVTITIGSKKFTKTTNSEGAIVFKPNVGKGTFNIYVSYDGTKTIIKSNATKKVTGVKGNVKDPLKSKIPLKNGVPDIDVMPANYVMANGDLTYTVSKAQYRDVIKRDSYCLFLNKKLSKFTFFKSKAEPKINHIIQREKWNVIERAINTKIVKKNKNGYWPASVTVYLKGKAYTYSEVRDKQNNGYTCAPTSGSMCSQVLRNYVCEKQLAKQAGTIYGFGTKCQWIKKALEKNHFKCSYFTKSSYNKALKQLKKGGCALIFHANNHYVSILDISKDGNKVLVSNSYGRYDAPGANLPNKWLSVKHVKSRFCSYDQRSLIVKLNYNLKKSTKKKVNNFYSSMGTKWTRQNTNERILDIGY